MLFFNLFLSINPLLLSWSFQSLKCFGVREWVARLFVAAWSAYPPSLSWPECHQPGPFSVPFPSSHPQLFSFFPSSVHSPTFFSFSTSPCLVHTRRKEERCTLSRFSHVRLCDPIDCSPPGSSVHGILQAKTLEWIAISSSTGSCRPNDGTQVSYISCIGK